MKLITSLFALLVIAACSNSEQAPDQANNEPTEVEQSSVTIVSASTIYTVNPAAPTTQAFAHDKGKIIAIGTTEQLTQEYPNAALNAYADATIVPGIIDAHGHLLGLGQSLIYVDLMGTESEQEIIQRLQQAASNLLEGQWLLGRGWDQNDWPVKDLPTNEILDAAFPDTPVWLERVDGHASWGNSKAMSFAEQDLSGEWQPEGGEILRNQQGQATGVFIDNAANLIQNKVPAPSEAELTEALNLAMAKTASVGITGMHDAGTSLQVWKLLQQLDAQQQLNVRVYAMANGANEMLDYLCENGAVIDPDAMLSARSVKLYSDGALGSRGAAMLADYSDDPGNTGLLIESQDSLTKHATRAIKCGLQVNIHAIGDRGNRVTLDVLEASQTTDNPGRHRIEHSQVIAMDDLPRFKQLGLIASVQPTHATSDMYWAEDRVGEQRIKGAYAWQKLTELGVPLALGSDFPVERADPLPGFYAAITRQDAKNWPADGWYPEERLSREQALHGFTLGAAYAAFQEQQLGSLEVGKQADFVVLSKDIMQVEPAEILNTQVRATYINGEAVYTAE